ncbi:MAG TPA: TolC family protein, partial [Ferruginibacter sp.]|nr:TolC family protein [Ferruginibacter sp.]
MIRFLLIMACCCWLRDAYGQKRSLEYFVQQGVTNSPLLKDLANQVKINQLDSLLIIAAQRPQVSFKSDDMYAPVVNGWGYDEAITNKANVNGLFAVSKTLNNSISNNAQFANIRLLSDAARNKAAISEQDIRRSIIGQYITTYGDWLQVQFSQEIQQRLSSQEDILKKLTEKNVYKQVDYLSFVITVKQSHFKLKQQVNQYRNDYAVLNYLA